MGDRIYSTENELINALKNILLNSLSIISIDGVDGLGKTTLSNKIAKELNLPNIELDDFVQEIKVDILNTLTMIVLPKALYPKNP